MHVVGCEKAGTANSKLTIIEQYDTQYHPFYYRPTTRSIPEIVRLALERNPNNVRIPISERLLLKIDK